MLPSQRFYASEHRKSERLHAQSSAENLLDGGDSMMSLASKSHKDAERRRRQRINAHLSTLRTLLPNSTKADKATLLAQVVQHVKELRMQADDVAHQQGKAQGTGSETGLFPGELDEATLSYCEVGDEEMKATLCCEDRPGLSLDLARAIRSVRARAVRAEMMTVGGRTKSVVVVKWPGAGAVGEEEVGALKRALKAVVENRGSGSGLGRALSGNKRGRFNDDDDACFCYRGIDRFL